MPLLNIRERFDRKHELLPSGCWRWTDALSGTGYGYLQIGGRAGHKVPAHRLAYELFIGPIPVDHQIDHLCRNRWCVNPQHLDAVTQRENLLRGETITARNAAVTHCPQGHPYDEANTVVRRGKRHCRTCANARRRTCHQRAREASCRS